MIEPLKFFESKTAQKRKRKVLLDFFQKIAGLRGRAPTTFRRKRNLIPSRPGREQKEKRQTRRFAADDPAPSFCLQNDGLEFSKFFSTVHLRQ